MYRVSRDEISAAFISGAFEKPNLPTHLRTEPSLAGVIGKSLAVCNVQAAGKLLQTANVTATGRPNSLHI